MNDMKKTYQKPETQAFAIQVTLLNDPSVPVKPNGGPITDPSQIQSRRHYSVWDDEEDDKEWK